MVADTSPIDWTAITKANADLGERLFNEGVHLIYDEDGDTLLITIGEGGPSITKHAIDDIYIRVHPESLKITGCTIIAFASDLLTKNKLVRKMLPDALETLKAADGAVEWAGHQAEKTKPLFDAALVH